MANGSQSPVPQKAAHSRSARQGSDFQSTSETSVKKRMKCNIAQMKIKQKTKQKSHTLHY